MDMPESRQTMEDIGRFVRLAYRRETGDPRANIKTGLRVVVGSGAFIVFSAALLLFCENDINSDQSPHLEIPTTLNYDAD